MGLAHNKTHNRLSAAVMSPRAQAERAEVLRRLVRAGQILKGCALPKELAALAGRAGSWPTIVHSRSDHAAWRPATVGNVKPSGADLDDLDEVLGWLFWLDLDTRPIVFAKMVGYGFRRIAVVDKLNRKRPRITADYNLAIDTIVRRLHGVR